MRFALLALAACGRLGFDATGDAGGRGGAGDGAMPGVDAPVTGPVGPRWVAPIDNAYFTYAGGSRGEATVAAGFSMQVHIAGQTITAQAFISTVVARFSTTGALLSTAVLDATGFCDTRGVTMIGDSTLEIGYTAGSSMPSYGPCAITTNRQDPIGFVVDPTGGVTSEFHFVASGANAQAWDVTRLSDGSLAMAGTYGSGLAMGATMLPTAGTDNAWYARVPAGGGDPIWTGEMVSSSTTWAGAVSSDGSDTCMYGAYSAATSLFGVALNPHGSADGVVARVDANGAARFVRELGSPGVESTGDASVLATPDGGCLVSLASTGDLVVDSTTFLAADGGGVLLRFDATGALVRGMRVPQPIALASVQGHVFGAMSVNAPTAFPNTTYTPQGWDVAIVELDAADVPVFVDAVGGAGDQMRAGDGALATIAPDAVAVSLTTSGVLSFAGMTSDSSSTQVSALAVLGVAP